MEQQQRKPKFGEHVLFVDPVGVARPALVTAVWGSQCVNVVLVSGDESKTDTFGRQIERNTSCVHASLQQAHGNYWRYPEDAPKPTERMA